MKLSSDVTGPDLWKSTMVQVLAWCHHHAISHYLSQCWPSSIAPYGITRLAYGLHIEARMKWTQLCRPHFRNHFDEWLNKRFYILIHISSMCVPGGVQLTINNGLGNDLGLNRWQTVTWGNVGNISWSHMLSLSLDQLINSGQLLIMWLEQELEGDPLYNCIYHLS